MDLDELITELVKLREQKGGFCKIALKWEDSEHGEQIEELTGVYCVDEGHPNVSANPVVILHETY